MAIRYFVAIDFLYRNFLKYRNVVAARFIAREENLFQCLVDLSESLINFDLF